MDLEKVLGIIISISLIFIAFNCFMLQQCVIFFLLCKLFLFQPGQTRCTSLSFGYRINFIVQWHFNLLIMNDVILREKDVEWPTFSDSENRSSYSPDREREKIFMDFKPATEEHRIRNKKRQPKKGKKSRTSIRLISGRS